MAIRYAEVSPGQQKYLVHLAAADILQMLDDGNVTGIAAIHEADDKRRAVGYMEAARRSDGTVELLWLYVAKAFRGQGIAKTFLRLLHDAARTDGMTRISVMMYPTMMEADYLPEDMARFLSAQWKVYETEPDDPWMLTKAELCAEDFVRKAPVKLERMTDRICAVKDMDKAERRRILSAIRQEADVGSATDPNVSCAIRSKDGWEGILLADKYGDVYEPRVFSAKNRQQEMQLLLWSALRLTEEMKANEYLRIRGQLPRFGAWADKLFADAMREKGIRMGIEL